MIRVKRWSVRKIESHHQKSPHEHVPSLNKWNRAASLTRISLWVILLIYFVALWQSPQTLRFLNTRMGRPGGTKINPKAIASFSLWWLSIFIFSDSSTSWRTDLISGTYPSSIILQFNLSSSEYISSENGLDWSSAKICAPYSYI
jgi:hypothetical protein